MVQTGDSGDEDYGFNPRWTRIFIIVPRIRTATKYKIEKLSVVTGDRTHNLHLPRLTYIPLVHPCASHRRNKLYNCMSHYCTERLAIFFHYQNPTSSSWETVIRISDPDFNPDHAQLWTRSSYDHYLPTHQISSKSDQYFMRNPANKQTNKQTNKHTKVIAISRFSWDKNEGPSKNMGFNVKTVWWFQTKKK